MPGHRGGKAADAALHEDMSGNCASRQLVRYLCGNYAVTLHHRARYLLIAIPRCVGDDKMSFLGSLPQTFSDRIVVPKRCTHDIRAIRSNCVDAPGTTASGHVNYATAVEPLRGPGNGPAVIAWGRGGQNDRPRDRLVCATSKIG